MCSLAEVLYLSAGAEMRWKRLPDMDYSREENGGLERYTKISVSLVFEVWVGSWIFFIETSAVVHL